MILPLQLKDVLKGLGPHSCPEYNFHCHSTCSDGSLSPIDLVKQATSIGIKHLAVTDHHSIKSYLPMYDWIRANNKPLNLWTGIEITCLIQGNLVHVLGLDFDYQSKFLVPYTQEVSVQGLLLKAENVVEAIHKSGGLVVLAHPARYKISFKEVIMQAYELGFDGIETWYDYTYSKNWEPTPLICESIHKVCQSLNMLTTCGTDSHGYDLRHR